MNHRTVVGIDDSEGSRAALRWALRNAHSTGSAVVVVHAYESSIAWIDVGSKEAPRMAEHDREHAETAAHRIVEETLDAVDSDLRSVPVTVLAILGDPSKALLDAAQDADLLVVGSRGRGGFAGVLLGSVSQRAAQHAQCPVVIVRN